MSEPVNATVAFVVDNPSGTSICSSPPATEEVIVPVPSSWPFRCSSLPLRSTVTPSGTHSTGIPRQSTESAANVAFPASMRRNGHGIVVPAGAFSAVEPEHTITRVSSQGRRFGRTVPELLRHSQLAAESRLVPSPAPVHVAVAATLLSFA